MTDTEYVPELFDSKAKVRPLDSYSPDDLARMTPAERVVSCRTPGAE